MSKDKPEVGDVYKNGYGNKILITKVWEYNNENSPADCIAQTWRGKPFALEVRHIPLAYFRFLDYLGTSAENFEQLFEVENEE